MSDMKLLSEKESEIIERFRQYLRIPSVQPTPDYYSCVQFLQSIGDQIGLKSEVLYPVSNSKPVLILSWRGRMPHLPSIMLNSHMDVVPVNTPYWSLPPFDAVMRENGDIVARGAQDMKCIGMSYLEALGKLKTEGWLPERSIHVTFVPDEEIGGVDGMQAFIKTDLFKQLNVGFALDEGVPSPHAQYVIFDAEKSPLWIKAHARGNAGHGSMLIQGTAIDKILQFIGKVKEYTDSERQRLVSNGLELGDITTMNITMIQAGEQQNIVPGDASVNVDIRMTPLVPFDTIYSLLYNWAQSSEVTVEYLQKPNMPNKNPGNFENSWKLIIANTLTDLAFSYATFPGATDSRFLREIGIPAIGLSPYNHTRILLHDHDEYLNASTYLKGIEIHERLIRNLAESK